MKPIDRSSAYTQVRTNVLEREEALLVARHEERDYRICVQVFDLPIGKCRASEANRVASAVADS